MLVNIEQPQLIHLEIVRAALEPGSERTAKCVRLVVTSTNRLKRRRPPCPRLRPRHVGRCHSHAPLADIRGEVTNRHSVSSI